MKKGDVDKSYIFEGKEDLEIKLISYLDSYNFDVKLKQLDYKTPADYLETTYPLCTTYRYLKQYEKTKSYNQ